jgi:hypothetical protein
MISSWHNSGIHKKGFQKNPGPKHRFLPGSSLLKRLEPATPGDFERMIGRNWQVAEQALCDFDLSLADAFGGWA